LKLAAINILVKHAELLLSVGAFPVTGAYFGGGNGPAMSHLSCVGTENNVSECSVGSVGQLNCHHGRDVGVICQGSFTEYTIG